MRIYDLDLEKKTNKIIIYLTPDEAQEMKYSLEQIINNDEKYHHKHILDSEYKREITLCIYKEDNLSSFDERSKRLIQYDE